MDLLGLIYSSGGILIWSSLFYKQHFLCLYVYEDAIVDITPQLITLNQRSKSDNIIRTSTQVHRYLYKIVLFLFLRWGLLFLKVTLGTGFQSVKSMFVFRKKR
jgi:hypothetical protein